MATRWWVLLHGSRPGRTRCQRVDEETRAFYRTLGFLHLEEQPTLWGTDNPALQMVKIL